MTPRKPAAPARTSVASAPVEARGFAGFPGDALAFLAELADNNDRAWFERRRERFEASCRGPALAFIAAMGPELARITKHFVADPRPIGGSLMRIHRDVRFSADKSPYKTNIGLHFRHRAGKDVHAPGLYLHIAPDECFLGVGIWHPPPDVLAKIRKRIVERPSEWRAARDGSAFRNAWKIGGESLARPPRGFDPEHPHIDDIKRKDHVAMGQLAFAEVGQPDLPKRVGKRFAAAQDYVKFLCQAVGATF